MRNSTTLSTRPISLMAIARISSLMAACMATAVLAPTAVAYALMWAACKANCAAFGWISIAYSPAVGAVIAAIPMAIFGMAAYRRTIALTTPLHRKRVTIAYWAAAGTGLLVLAVTPYLPIAQEPLSKIVVHIARQI